MLRGCLNAGIGEDRQRKEMPVGRGLKMPKPKLGCSAIEEEEKDEETWLPNPTFSK